MATEASILWETYPDRRDPDVRDALVTQNLALVHHVARQLMRSLPIDIELDDLLSAGTIGLIKAIESFEPQRGLAFSTFAAPRIRGAILDDLRRWDHAPRSIRRKQRRLASAASSLRTRLDRPPSDAETAEELGVDVERVWRWRSEVEEAVQVSIDHPQKEADRSGTSVDALVGDPGDLDGRLNREQEVEHLRREILELKEQERIVLSLYYFEELKMHQIAEVLGLTESRVSQIRSKALSRLRGRMAHLREVCS